MVDKIILCVLIIFAVTNGKHQWVPKGIAEAAEKYAKVGFDHIDDLLNEWKKSLCDLFMNVQKAYTLVYNVHHWLVLSVRNFCEPAVIIPAHDNYLGHCISKTCHQKHCSLC